MDVLLKQMWPAFGLLEHRNYLKDLIYAINERFGSNLAIDFAYNEQKLVEITTHLRKGQLISGGNIKCAYYTDKSALLKQKAERFWCVGHLPCGNILIMRTRVDGTTYHDVVPDGSQKNWEELV